MDPLPSAEPGYIRQTTTTTSSHNNDHTYHTNLVRPTHQQPQNSQSRQWSMHSYFVHWNWLKTKTAYVLLISTWTDWWFCLKLIFNMILKNWVLIFSHKNRIILSLAYAKIKKSQVCIVSVEVSFKNYIVAPHALQQPKSGPRPPVKKGWEPLF